MLQAVDRRLQATSATHSMSRDVRGESGKHILSFTGTTPYLAGGLRTVLLLRRASRRLRTWLHLSIRSSVILAGKSGGEFAPPGYTQIDGRNPVQPVFIIDILNSPH